MQGWRARLVSPANTARLQAVRDSVVRAVARVVGDAPKCRDGATEGLMRVTSWRVRSYELAIVTHEPHWGGLPAYEITVGLRQASGACGDSVGAARPAHADARS